ncbi:MAG: WYL domain-containing protein [Ignavibacteria bacterium]|nr:WYL domain-containing protein [Ignavibacteria bacterium]MBI3766421.1 WYL domain-containing protein [Ignavibacteriales bacterium]
MRPRPSKKSLINHHIDDVDFLVVDVETTGLAVETGDRVCELGAVKLRGGAVVDTFTSLIDPQRPISAGAYAVNRISPTMLFNAPTFSAVAERFQRMMDTSILVAYNAPFDLSFLTNEFRLAGFREINNTVIDALPLARQLLPGIGKYPQENVARILGIPFPVKHRAFDDTMVTAQLFIIFISILKAHGCHTCADLLRRDLAQTFLTRRMTIVNEALTRHTNLWIKYLSPTNAEITDRIITPKTCNTDATSRNGTTYLEAFCHSAQAERNFRVDRILDIRLVEPAIA